MTDSNADTSWTPPPPLNTSASMLVFGESGDSKCLGKGTPVLRYDGHIVPVEEVKEGDLLMGVGGPRRVLSTTAGEGPLYLIRPVKGTPWVCNENHILTLVSCVDGTVIDIPLPVWLEKNKTFKSIYKQVSTGVRFAEQEEPLPVDPYFLGLWFGDGTREKYNGDLRGVRITKPDPEVRQTCEDMAAMWGLRVTETTNSSGCPTFAITTGVPGRENPLLEAIRSLVGPDLQVPHSYLTASPEARRAFLAGWLDADGSLQHGVFNFCQKRKAWADAVAFLARSLGLRATQNEFEVAPHGMFHRVTISGDMETLPLRIPRKKPSPRKQIKDVRRTGITVELLGHGEFYGFELDGDGRFLLGDFTVTHNSTQCALAALWVAQKYRLRTRYYSYDEGGIPDLVEYLWKDAGVIDVFRARSIDPNGQSLMSQGAMSLYAKGYWPAAMHEDGTIIGSELLPPSLTSFEFLCPSGHVVGKSEDRAGLVPGPCPTCQTSVHGQNARVRRVTRKSPQFADIGLIVHDGITAACDWLTGERGELSARGLAGGESGRGGGRTVVTSMGIRFGSAGMSAIGEIQEMPRQWSIDSSQVFGIVAPTIWTARTLRLEVSAKNINPVVGPKLVGKAKTGEATAWYGNSVNVVKYKGEYRIYYSQWEEEDGTVHRCKVRSLPASLPEDGYLVRTPEEAAAFEETGDELMRFGSCSLGKLFDLMLEARNEGVRKFVDSFGLALPARAPSGADDGLEPFAQEPVQGRSAPAAGAGPTRVAPTLGAPVRRAPAAPTKPTPAPEVSTPFDDPAPPAATPAAPARPAGTLPPPRTPMRMAPPASAGPKKAGA